MGGSELGVSGLGLGGRFRGVRVGGVGSWNLGFRSNSQRNLKVREAMVQGVRVWK